MPDKPTWCGRLPDIARRLRALPDPWVDRATLQDLLHIGRRRAQQLLSPCVVRQIGASGVADREAILAHLHRLAGGETVHYERQRRRRFSERLNALRRERAAGVWVPAPESVVNQRLENLPAGVSIAPGRITVEFRTPAEALEKLLALGMAIGNDELLFERLATGMMDK